MASDNKQPIQSWEVLLRAFELERSKGCVDSAVLGGVDRLITNYATALELIDPEFDPKKFQYRALQPGSRETLLVKWIAEITPRINFQGAQLSPSGLKAVVSETPSHYIDLKDSISVLRSVTPRRVKGFEKLDIRTVRQLLYHFPRKYARICTVAELRPSDEESAVMVRLRDIAITTSGKMKKSTEAIAYDSTGAIRVLWFNQAYLAKTLKNKPIVMLRGKVGIYRNNLVLESPEVDTGFSEPTLHSNTTAVAVYGSTSGLTQAAVRSAIQDSLIVTEGRLLETLPIAITNKLGLISIDEALRNIHFPESNGHLEQARRRLEYEEMLQFQLQMQTRRRDWRNQDKAWPVVLPAEMRRDFVEALPFGLTASQQEGIDELFEDLSSEVPMSRLLHGEVGSGKTVVAVAAMLASACSNKSSLMMAPTEILAEQHFQTIAKLIGGDFNGDNVSGSYVRDIEATWFVRRIRIALLTGGIPAKQKRKIIEELAAGTIDIVVGTHALIQEGIQIPSLALAIVDEQHRFGVMQRQHVRELSAGARPHLLIMSATPIPRTLRLAHYGDLDISVLSELPGNRKPVKTSWARSGQRDLAYGFLRKQIQAGRQGFIICPLVEGSEAIQSRSAVEEYERLGSDVYPELSLGLLHGRMKPREKLEIMEQFRSGTLDILVTTSVVEVGVDVPNATVVVIDGADRFGMAQLHQFRGRVGRGQHQGYCILLADNPSESGTERLEIVERVKDGFTLAEEDLRIRGEGDLLGTVQSGIMEFKLADFNDIETVTQCQIVIKELLDSDPEMKEADNALFMSSLQLDRLDP